jgi:hypothetical protein
VDLSGQEITFDPAAPTMSTPVRIEPDRVGLDNVSCPSTHLCQAFDGLGRELAFDPTTGVADSAVTIGAPAYSSAVACPSTDQCTAVGWQGQEMTFDPTAPGIPTLYSIDKAALTPTALYAYMALACPSASRCVAVDRWGDEVTFDPVSPGTPTRVLIDDTAPQNAVACPTRSRCIVALQAVGHYVPPGINEMVELGPASPAIPLRSSSGIGPGVLDAIACPSQSQCTAVSRAVNCPACLVGQGGRVFTFNPGRLPTGSAVAALRIDSASLTGVACPSTSQCTAVDIRGRELTFNPRRPAKPHGRKIDGSSGLPALACPSRSQCTAVDNHGLEMTFDPLSPAMTSVARIDGRTSLSSLACPSSVQCTALDGDGREVTFDPLRPARLTTHRIDSGPLTGVACPTTRFCVTVDTTGNAIEGDP